MNNKLTKLKTNSTAIILILLMASVILIAIPALPVQAQQLQQQSGSSVLLPAGVTPDVRVKTTAYLSFRPNPVGVGQTILVNMWLNPGSHPSRQPTGFQVTITKPDGTQDVKTLNSYPGDSTAWFEYTVDQVGTWKLKFVFPGGYYPPGIYISTYQNPPVSFTFTNSSYFEPSSTPEQTLTVQQDIVASWPASPLPTDYWTRPVSPENREWISILGDYPWYGPGGGADWPANTNTYTDFNRYNFIPYVQAPNTAHIVWRQQGGIGGLAGATTGLDSFTAGGGNPNIIFEGRGYQTIAGVSQTGPSSQNYRECYDIRTGQLYWQRPLYPGEAAPTVIEYTTPVATSYSGTLSANLVSINNGLLTKYNPYTGAVSLNVSISPLTTGMYYMNGYALTVQNLGTTTNPNYRLINWTTLGSGNLATRIMNNITWGDGMAGFGALGTTAINCTVDYNTGVAVYAAQVNWLPFSPYVTGNASGTYAGTNVIALSLATGHVIWNRQVSDIMYVPSVSVADHGKFAALMQGGYFLCWDLQTGNQVWKSGVMDYPWSEPAFGAYAIQSAYGMFYREAYDGVWAFNWDTGKIVWHYEDITNPYETPYTDVNGTAVNSFNGGGFVADGKLYTYNTEHTPSQPITRGWKLHCINATTGMGIWNITGSMTPGAVADGYLAASNTYDGYTYVFGKGQSASTVSAPQTAITQGQSIIFTGTVLDQSPGQPGTPCVSKESMKQWMEHLHMQKAIPANVIGVPVSIDAVDPNGNSVHIADVTSDMSGTFGYTWAPTLVGQYKITATFMGDDSYGSSWAQTYASVTQAQAATSTAAPISFDAINGTLTTTIIGAAIAIIVAIALIGILILRKRP